MKRELLFSVGINDCRVEVMRNSKGAGGQKRDKTSSKVRVTHPPSGASASCGDHRQQSRNKRDAFLRMIETEKYRGWHRRMVAELMSRKTVAEVVDEQMHPENLRIETRVDGRWQIIDER